MRYRAQRGGIWYPEDRLRVTLIGASTLVPLSVLIYGFVPQIVEDKRIGLVLDLACLFMNGLGVGGQSTY